MSDEKDTLLSGWFIPYADATDDNTDEFSDFSEIAAYGTQPADYKQASVCEEPAIIKGEYNFELDPLEECSSNLIIRDNILNTPIIYTTKLDHMKAFHKIEKHTTNKITDMILEESKPRYKPPELFEPKSTDADITTYIKLSSQVHQLNTKVKIETFQRNQQLLKLCKPLTIVLNDIMTDRQSEPKTTIIPDDAEDRFADTNSDDEPLAMSVIDPLENVNNEILKFTFTITVGFKNKLSQEVDLYIVNSCSGVTSYYRTSKNQCGLLQRLYRSKKLIFLEYCCWVDREKYIKRLVAQGCIRSSVVTFMRTSHNCLPRPCSCCCTFGSFPRKRYDAEFNTLFKKININDEFVITINNNKTIEKAFKYVPKADIIPMPTPPGAKPLNILANAVIIIKYQQIIFAQTDILGENYEIGSKGEIISYVKPTINRSIAEEKQLYQKQDELNEHSRLYIPHLICCWHRREVVIAHLANYSYVLPSTLRFIRTPHTCKVAKCQCCCKPVPMIAFNLEQVEKNYVAVNNKKQDKTNTYKELKQKEPLQKKTSQFIYFDKFGRDKIEEKDINEHLDEIQSNERSKDIRKRKAPNKTQVVSKSIKSSVSNVPQRTRKNIDLTVDSRNLNIKGHKRQPISTSSGLNTDTQSKPSVNPSVTNISNLAHLTTTPTSLVQRFLDHIKDFKLNVNENGKLTAMINTLPDKVSNVDVKMISEILLLASAQIEALGITPQEFCDRVNASQSRQSLNSLLSPHSNIYKSTVNNSAITPNFKALRLDKNLPKTNNLRSVCSIFQAMSSLAGQKNEHLVEAYRIHLRSTIAKNIMLSNKLTCKRPRTTEVTSPVAKRKTMKKAYRTAQESQVIPVNDQNVVDQTAIVKNQTPFRTEKNSNKVVVTQPTARIAHNQFQTYINNSTLKQTSVNKPDPQITNTDVPRHDFINNKSNLVPTQSLIDMVVPSLVVDARKRVTTAQQPQRADPSINATPSAVRVADLQTVMETENLIFSSSCDDEVLPINSKDNDVKNLFNNTSDIISGFESFVSGIPQTIASDSKKNLLEKPVPLENPLLFQMLSKTSSTPCPIMIARKCNLEYGPQKLSGSPHIRKNSKAKLKQNIPQPPHIRQKKPMVVEVDKGPIILEDEFDIEESLKTNVISVAEPSKNKRLEEFNNKKPVERDTLVAGFSENERFEVVNNKQLMGDNDVECIFGV